MLIIGPFQSEDLRPLLCFYDERIDFALTDGAERFLP
jgi:hypothetical protein